ncbi:folate-sensitive fragile site protein Fra10Ac1-domain-containing protein [Pterulicium gracile]|uniref:Folate-sensitive fragile site protein Fra10Ac1-domain-containing protein n=1 Tax=Pterulicium gracile TaxID=1884261 RepID=A0A5C3Q9L6_9AGAR|nr:folate-sensitive fragile site protein Fra10Ac1-domain-containing protein [Pterula gracilis]
MALASSSKQQIQRHGKTEFEILKESHKFLRDDDKKDLTWNDQLAAKYYSSLYREYGVCDLKHYKSGDFALRWRTEDEVLSGAGETTCGNTRCKHHDGREAVKLSTLEVPFTYMEEEETKSALVKMVLCSRCLRKMMYKREQERQGVNGTKRRRSRSHSPVRSR